jgi:hypothetical protein
MSTFRFPPLRSRALGFGKVARKAMLPVSLLSASMWSAPRRGI